MFEPVRVGSEKMFYENDVMTELDKVEKKAWNDALQLAVTLQINWSSGFFDDMGSQPTFEEILERFKK